MDSSKLGVILWVKVLRLGASSGEIFWNIPEKRIDIRSESK